MKARHKKERDEMKATGDKEAFEALKATQKIEKNERKARHKTERTEIKAIIKAAKGK